MKKLLMALLAAVIFSGFGIPIRAAAAPVLNFTIEFDGIDFTGKTFNLRRKDSVEVEIFFSLSDGGAVGAGFDLSFDNRLLSASNLELGPGWNDPGGSGIDDKSGHVFFEGLAFSPIDAGLLIAFDFACIKNGIAPLKLGDLNDQPNWLVIVNSGQLILDDQLIPPIEIASVNQVPIPGAIWLLGTGIIGVLGLRKNIRR